MDTGFYTSKDTNLFDVLRLFPTPTGIHELLISKIMTQIDSFLSINCRNNCSVFGSNTGLFLGNKWDQISHLPSVQETFKDKTDFNLYNELYILPDIQVICDYSKEQFTQFGYTGIPKICVEVLSPTSVKRDWLVKKDIYELIKVLEYWIIADVSSVFVFSLVNDKYVSFDYIAKSPDEELQIPSVIFDGLVVKLNPSITKNLQ